MDNVENINKKMKISTKLSIVFFAISLLASGFLIYNILLLDGIENLIRYIVITSLGIIDILSLIKLIKVIKNKQSKRNIKKGKESKRIGYITFLILFSIICGGLSYIISYYYGTLNTLNKKYVTYSSSLIVMSDNKADKVKDIKDYKIGMLKDKKSPEGYIIPNEIIKKYKLKDKNDIKKYDNYTAMISDLYTGDADAIFLSSDYADIYSSIAGYEEIKTETKKIVSKSKKMKKSDVSKSENESSGKSVNEPFTILLMGIDSTDEVLTKNAVANGDSLVLITFNPKTLNATMISIPRDSYVPIACWPGKEENKITHAAAYGNDCMINTIEEYFDVNIDYYTKINFKGLVHLVDALGGIDVDVPQDLCTDDSSRGQIKCISAGHQHLDGEGALVLSRNRKQLKNGDFGRGQNQQLVIKAMLEKIKGIRSIKQFNDILKTVSNSIDTNLTTKQILSFYSIAKDIVKVGSSSKNADIVNIQQLYLQGYGAMIYDKHMRMELYDYVPNTYSKKDITKAMKQNLGLASYKSSKTFSFSINHPYEKKIIGEGPYKSTYNASKYKKASDYTTKDKNKCGTNEELGADGVTCVCKYGYTKQNGICTEKKTEVTEPEETQQKEIQCGENEVPNGTGCSCKAGFTRVNGICTKEETPPEQQQPEQQPQQPSE